MQITAPVTDYIPASILTTLNDLPIRGAAIPERIAEVDWRGVHIGNDTRNAGGAQVITGAGFTSRLVAFLAVDDQAGNLNRSIGFDDGTTYQCLYIRSGGTNNVLYLTDSIVIYRDVGNRLHGHITAIGGDGFTITWALTGNCALDFIYCCIP